MQRRLPLVSLLSLSLCGAALPGCKSAPEPRDDTPSSQGCADSVSGLSWLSGEWIQRRPLNVTEEAWTQPEGGTLLGVSRAIVQGRTVFFEYMRIEKRADGLYFVAQPMGRAPSDFKLARCTAREVVFENPAHDYPQRILYRREVGGRLAARVEGIKDGKPLSEDFAFTRP
ncbi:DUF6265 family protein [Myxococcus stipitatus]|uniref:DUF6265 family protein n=1 Tax=Myxococcus stipitatus TaxID=83455 RepID=UPI001F340D85|nr:DUF6265 family protein [Myxococcus stipitatus]MCE9673670.1 DUF6265 family protein [Myxococcus stipitatus]